MPSRRRGQVQPAPQAEPFSDSDEFDEEDEDMLENGEMMEGEAEEIGEEEDEEEDDDEAPGSPAQAEAHDAPIPPNLREISTLASWTVSSSKPGCSVPQLRNPSTSLFWQSDGPQPHYLNIHFFKLVRIVGLRLFLDFDADESYTPTRIVFLAGSGNNDLVEWGEMRLEQPRGWIWADFSGVGDADDNDEGDDEEDEDGDEINEDSESESMAIPGLADALAAPDEGDTSDFENAQPGAVQAQAGAPMLTGLLDSADTPAPHGRERSPYYGYTPTNAPPVHAIHAPSGLYTTTPTLMRNHPRLPFQPLRTATPPPKKPKVKKMPVLRAHLVQIKILENHQNGKDTHLRGLQIFAKDSEGSRDVRAAASLTASVGMRTGRDMSVVRNGGGGGMGGSIRGLGRSSWEMEGSIR